MPGVRGSRVKVKAPSRRAPGQKAEAEESIQRGDVVLDSAVTGGEGQRRGEATESIA